MVWRFCWIQMWGLGQEVWLSGTARPYLGYISPWAHPQFCKKDLKVLSSPVPSHFQLLNQVERDRLL